MDEKHSAPLPTMDSTGCGDANNAGFIKSSLGWEGSRGLRVVALRLRQWQTNIQLVHDTINFFHGDRLLVDPKRIALNGLDDQRLSIFNQCVFYPHELPTERLPEQPRTTRYYESRSTAQIRHRPC